MIYLLIKWSAFCINWLKVSRRCLAQLPVCHSRICHPTPPLPPPETGRINCFEDVFLLYSSLLSFFFFVIAIECVVQANVIWWHSYVLFCERSAASRTTATASLMWHLWKWSEQWKPQWNPQQNCGHCMCPTACLPPHQQLLAAPLAFCSHPCCHTIKVQIMLHMGIGIGIWRWTYGRQLQIQLQLLAFSFR